MFSIIKRYTQEEVNDLLRIIENDYEKLLKDYIKQTIQLLEMEVGYNTIIRLLILYIFYLNSGFCFSFCGFCVFIIILIISDVDELERKKKFIQDV